MKVSEEILKMIAYKPGKPISETQREFGVTEVYKLASNENPLGMSPKAKAAIAQSIDNAFRYPDPSCFELISKISKIWNISRELISIGNGSDELIDLLVRIYCEPGEAILTSDAAFVAYSVRAAASRVRTIKVPMTHDYRTDVPAIAEYLRKNRETEKVRLVFFPNPNNPTGTYIRDSEVQKFLEEFGHRDDLLIVFDEAYNEFVRASDYRSSQNYFGKFKAVVVLRTLSKAYGLAGMRVGVAIAPAETIELMNRVRTPFNVNELAQVAAIAAVDDLEFIKASQELTWKGLDYFYQELKRLKLPYIESQGNFVMFDTQRDVRKVDYALLKRGVILRPILNYGFSTHIRMSVGLENENKIAIQALEEVLREIPPIGK
jgi:histidinol-phosphate aminotransferase